MANKNSEYWQQRFGQLENASHQEAMTVYSRIEESFYQAQREIENKINSWYVRFANNNEITINEAKKLLNSNELKEFKWDVQEYIKYGHENELNELWMKELENASTKYHISRLEALKIQTQQTMEKLFGNELDEVDNLTKNSYINNYFHTMFEYQKGFNVGFNVTNIDQNKLSKIVNKPWAVDEKNFSERIWGNKTKLINELHNELTKMCLTGKSPDESIKYLSKKFNTSKAQAGNLIMTENAYFSQLAQKDCFNALDVEKYEIVATLDSHTSEICKEQDGKVYDMKDYQPGITAPPFHNYCRSTTVPHFDDDFDLEGERAARDEDGKTYYVSDKMKYDDWYKKYVQNQSNLQNEAKNAKIKTHSEKIQELQNILMDMNEARRIHWDLSLTSKEEMLNSSFKDLAYSIDLEGIDEKVIDTIIENYKQLGDEYYTTLNHIGIFDDEYLLAKPNSGGYEFTGVKTLTGEIHFNQTMLDDFDDYVETMKNCSEFGHISKSINPENYKYYVPTHEFAHSIFNSGMVGKNLIGMDENIYKNFGKELEKMFEQYKTRINEIDSKLKALNSKFVLNTENFTSEDSAKLKALKKEQQEIFVSNYAIRDNLKDEFMAECFAEAKLSSNPSKTALEVLKLIDKYFKR
jgi:SPP1 gp7 family putative phage head morphogenesis protein